MKKNVATAMLLMLALIAGCTSSEENDSKKVNPEQSDKGTKSERSEETSRAVAVDKGLVDVEVTIPSSFFPDDDLNEVATKAKESGMKSATVNPDDTITYKMSKAKHKELMSKMKNNLVEYTDELVSNDDFSSIKDITYDKNFKEFSMVVDQEAIENSFDGFAVLGLGMAGMFYQLFDGVNSEQLDVTIHSVNEATGERIGTVNYPKDLEDLGESEE
ncbi:hypothetical protein [Sporosarcina sp. P7]|uniref:hypothetical protein n=1 Tax=Sporosarcina sp. P7 TaxID=2048244 RepID=UPI000C163F40|nr:hypothetical protein [Sporosarcina sp. P7]PID23334.1 hypothetical protein CSV60_15365 [Sporosarcina sp. P7]